MFGISIPKIIIAVAALALVFGGLHKMKSEAYDRGVADEKAEQAIATLEAQAAHEKEIAVKDEKIAAISKSNGEERFKLASRNSALQQRLLERSDEDFLCSPDQPVFSDSLLDQLNALGRDQHKDGENPG